MKDFNWYRHRLFWGIALFAAYWVSHFFLFSDRFSECMGYIWEGVGLIAIGTVGILLTSLILFPVVATYVVSLVRGRYTKILSLINLWGRKEEDTPHYDLNVIFGALQITLAIVTFVFLLLDIPFDVADKINDVNLSNNITRMELLKPVPQAVFSDSRRFMVECYIAMDEAGISYINNTTGGATFMFPTGDVIGTDGLYSIQHTKDTVTINFYMGDANHPTTFKFPRTK